MSEPFDRETDDIGEGVTQIIGPGAIEGTGAARHLFTVKAVETIHQDYAVDAADEAQAADRLRRYFADPGMVAPGVVAKQGDGERVRWRIPSEKTDAKK